MEARRRTKSQCGFYGGEKLRNRVAVSLRSLYSKIADINP
jgi:hypothetical protein